MAVNIAKVGVAISVGAAKFTSGLRSVKNSFKSFSRSTAEGAKSWSSSFGMSFATTIAKITIFALAFRRMARTLLSEFKNLDEARKFAQSIGQAGENATDKLLAFEFAAQRVGASSAVARTGLRTMSKSIGEAQLGMGAGAAALKIMGLEAEKLGTMMPTDAFLEISKAMNKMENSSLKTAAAQKVFGRAGVRMLNLARLRGESIAELINRHKQLAGVMSEGDIAGVEATNDALADLVTAYKGFQRQLMAGISPSLFTWLSVAADMIAKLREGAKDWGEKINNFVFASIKNVATMLPGIIGLFKGIGAAVWNIVLVAKMVNELMGDIFGKTPDNPFELISIGLAIIGNLLAELPNLADAAFDIIKGTASSMVNTIGLGVSKVVMGLFNLIKKAGQGFADLVGAMALVPGMKHMKDEANSLKKVFDEMLDPFIDKQKKIQDGLNDNINKSAKTLTDAYDKFSGIFVNN